jgi:hypothetical protein
MDKYECKQRDPGVSNFSKKITYQKKKCSDLDVFIEIMRTVISSKITYKKNKIK